MIGYMRRLNQLPTNNESRILGKYLPNSDTSIPKTEGK